MNFRERVALVFPALLLCLALLSGCTQLGPRSITRDRFDYAAAVADSWKEQALLNIVKVHYADNAVFVKGPEAHPAG